MTSPPDRNLIPLSPAEFTERRKLSDSALEHRRLRMRRHGRRAYIRSVYSLPSLCTLGNAICGFAAMYVAGLDAGDQSADPLTQFFTKHHFIAAAYLIFAAALFDALDGRLARFARHTTDFGGQLDSLADVISFGAAPAFIAMALFKSYHTIDLPPMVTRLVWAIGAFYTSCAAIRLARFNVSNEHGEQHHFSFLGLPSPGAGTAIAAYILMQQEIAEHWTEFGRQVANVLPLLVLINGLLMVSAVRYPHLVNRYLRGRRSLGNLLAVLILLLMLIVAHRYILAIGSVGYALSGAATWAYVRLRRRIRQRPAGTGRI